MIYIIIITLYTLSILLMGIFIGAGIYKRKFDSLINYIQIYEDRLERENKLKITTKVERLERIKKRVNDQIESYSKANDCYYDY
jgi:hypothetical protein